MTAYSDTHWPASKKTNLTFIDIRAANAVVPITTWTQHTRDEIYEVAAYALKRLLHLAKAAGHDGKEILQIGFRGMCELVKRLGDVALSTRSNVFGHIWKGLFYVFSSLVRVSPRGMLSAIIVGWCRRLMTSEMWSVCPLEGCYRPSL